jgi:hypothetical protein
MEKLSLRRRGPRRPMAVSALAALAVAALAAPAFASSVLKEEFAQFTNCPVETAQQCFYSTTTGGEFVIGRKTVPIAKTIVLQGGLPSTTFTAEPLEAARKRFR